MAGNKHFLLIPQYFCPFKERNCHLCYIYFVVCKCFRFGQGQILVVCEWVDAFLTGVYQHLISDKYNSEHNYKNTGVEQGRSITETAEACW